MSGSGVTLYGTETKPLGRALVFNGSTVVFRSGSALVKGRVSDIDAKKLYSEAFVLGDLKPPKTINIWMKAPNSPATVPVSAVGESEDKNYLIYSAAFASALPVLRSILLKEKIQIGFRVAGKTSDQVMFGTVEISPDENEQLNQCLKELAV